MVSTEQAQNLKVLLREANQVKQSGDDAKATELYQSILSINPDYVPALRQLAELSFAQKDFESAETYYEKVTSLNPKAPFIVYFRQGRSAQQQKHWQKAVDAYTKAIELKGEDARAYQFLADVQFAQKQFKPAANNYRKAIELGVESEAIRNKLGIIAKRQKNYDEALDYFKQAVSISPNNPSFHVSCGDTYVEKDQLEEAASCYQTAVSLDDQKAGVHFKLGKVKQQQQRPEAAIACYQKAILLDDSNPNFHYHLGTVWAEQEWFENARLSYGKALEVEPDFEPAQTALDALLSDEQESSVPAEANPPTLEEDSTDVMPDAVPSVVSEPELATAPALSVSSEPDAAVDEAEIPSLEDKLLEEPASESVPTPVSEQSVEVNGTSRPGETVLKVKPGYTAPRQTVPQPEPVKSPYWTKELAPMPEPRNPVVKFFQRLFRSFMRLLGL